jgi:predicted dehydrogenase
LAARVFLPWVMKRPKNLLAAGVIGDIVYAEGFWARHSPEGAWQYNVPKDGNEQTVDWKKYISNTTQEIGIL